jgi:type III restriction enzyme
MARKKRPIEQYQHDKQERLNNPPAGLGRLDTEPPAPPTTYAYDPHLDPQLVWAGKAEHTSFEVPTVSLHVHERIDPRTIIEAVRANGGELASGQVGEGEPQYVQASFFERATEAPPLRDAVAFYLHKHGWSNRLVAGDSLLVMNSLLTKEGLGGQVQMIYIDPPYGIKYGSNFQPFVNKRDLKDSAEEATVWVGGLDRIQARRGILGCYDFSATPLTPSGNRTTEEALFGWVVSDFGLDDAIESGLVKTPRVVVRDDARPDAATYRSRLFHIYNDPEVKDDLNRRAGAAEPLPQLVSAAYHLLGYDWRAKLREWQSGGRPTPPVMITVANRTETAARVAHAFGSGNIAIEELCDPDGMLHIDSKVLAEAEAMDEAPPERAQETPERESASEEEEEGEEQTRPLTRKEQAALLRTKVDTVGQPGAPGAQVCNVISVGMLSEGWDAKTVTHIMGLRAFSSQLLCEQVVGRGLRRTNYEVNPKTGRYDPEYVNVFGVPFTFMPFEGGGEPPPRPPKPTVAIEVDPAKSAYQLTWPNVSELKAVYLPVLRLDWPKVDPLTLDASETPMVAELAPVIEGLPDVSRIASIELAKLAASSRLQSVIFHAARDVFDQMQADWPGRKELLLAQLVRIVEQFIRSDRLRIHPPLFFQDALRRRLMLLLNMSRIVQHLWDALRYESNERLEPIFDQERAIGSTGDMVTWYTSKPAERTAKSHINRCVYDSAWEASDAYALDHHPDVTAWAKNDHLGFEIVYRYRGAVHKYRPDFLVRLSSGDMLILETKGQDSEQNQVKRRMMRDWTVAINEHGGFGRWHTDVAYRPGDIQDIIIRCLR